MVCWPGVAVVRWAICPALVARVTRVHAVEFVADVAPGVAGGVLDHPQEQQRQPAQLDVGADAVLAVVEHRAQPEGATVTSLTRRWSAMVR
jgi:hypothetical protein